MLCVQKRGEEGERSSERRIHWCVLEWVSRGGHRGDGGGDSVGCGSGDDCVGCGCSGDRGSGERGSGDRGDESVGCGDMWWWSWL